MAGGVLAGIWLTIFVRTRTRQQARAMEQVAREGASVSTGAATALDRQSSAALVMLDDARRTSEQALGSAEVQFGTAPTGTFAAVLADASAAALLALRIRQRLDDARPETEVERTAMRRQIVELCARANSTLNRQTVAFDDRRDLHRRAPQLLDETGRHATDASARVAASGVTLTWLGHAYADSSLISLVANPNHAAALFADTHKAVAKGRAALDSGEDDRENAAVDAEIAAQLAALRGHRD